jgi:L-iditol 2-dehydrogenase
LTPPSGAKCNLFDNAAALKIPFSNTGFSPRRLCARVGAFCCSRGFQVGMKALLLSQYNLLELAELPDPAPGPGEVLIRVAACGICGSDVHGYDGSSGRRIPPIVMGHEAAGIVAALGAGVAEFSVGDRVTFDSTVFCGSCPPCRRGEINLCDNRQVLGVSCTDYRRAGAFAEYVAVPSRIVYRLPDSLSFAEAAMLEAVAVAVHAVSLARISRDSAALVVGAGMIGLLVVQALHAAGCPRVLVSDIDGSRLKLARDVGAAATFSPETDIAAQIVQLTGGAG